MLEITSAVAIAIATTEVFKRALNITRRYVPLLSLIIGIGVSALANKGIDFDVIYSGIIVGLTASGLYNSALVTAGKR